ncbi:hypothetical protein GF366_04595 [Candidatus Peregrinibacteria bacterium]|nr:hypothetical protein [Candidatus Peregrinibacteria bacterium]
MQNKIVTNRKGTALLVALLVMGVLIAISLALSGLILREIRTTKEVLDAGRAFYAAESGIEVALYKLNNNLPGWEPEDEYVPLKIDDEYLAVGEYSVENTCSAYPCFDEDYDRDSADEYLRAYYDVLELNETITIPLFVVKNVEGELTHVPVGDFTVEFFAPFDPKIHFKEDLVETFKENLHGWDILRWKVFGIRENGYTEAITDFTALSKLNLVQEGVEESFVANAGNPTWFGSVGCGDVDQNKRYTDEIKCAQYSELYQSAHGVVPVKLEGQEAVTYVGTCLSTEAREYYDYGIDKELTSDEIRGCYPIKGFLDQHEFNYLTLTNLMNPSVFRAGVNKEYLSRLFFRVEFYEDEPESSNETVREYADITANGYSGGNKQSVNVKIRRGSFMPVFNFSLYSTYRKEGVTGEE